MAYEAARRALPEYAHRNSPKKFTQHQLLACLVLKEFLRIDYRGLVALLVDCPELRAAIHLQCVPHFTTLQKAADRLLKSAPANRLLDETVALARKAKLLRRRVKLAAIDSSGFESHHASRYFVRRRAKGGKTSGKWQRTTYTRFPKLALLCDCETHIILSAVSARGPSPDFGHLDPALTKAAGRARIGTLLADAGYDAEWIHHFCRLIFGTRTVIPAGHGRPTTKRLRGYWRQRMRTRFNHEKYGQRWQVETVFSMIKRHLDENVSAKTYHRQCRVLLLKAITHNAMIIRRTQRGFLQSSHNLFSA